MKNIFKATLAVAAVAAIGMGSYKAYGSYVATNVGEDDLILAENVLALSDPTSGNYRYPNKEGDAKFCTLFVYMSASGTIVHKGENENPQYEGKVEYTKSQVSGLKDRCPKKGGGCSPFSCQEVPY